MSHAKWKAFDIFAQWLKEQLCNFSSYFFLLVLGENIKIGNHFATRGFFPEFCEWLNTRMGKVQFFRFSFQTLQTLADIAFNTQIRCKTCNDLSHYMGNFFYFSFLSKTIVLLEHYMGHWERIYFSKTCYPTIQTHCQNFGSDSRVS